MQETNTIPFIGLATEVSLKKGQVLIQQYARAREFYLIVQGEVSFALLLDGEGQELAVGESQEAGIPVGWSGFNLPYRYASTVRVTSRQARAFRWDFEELKAAILAYPEEGSQFLLVVSRAASVLIQESVRLLGNFSPQIPPDDPLGEVVFQSTDTESEDHLVAFLRKSPFFEVFEEKPLQFIGGCIDRRQYRPGDAVYEQNGHSEGLYLLANGKVRFNYDDPTHQVVGFRQIGTPGFVIGWTGTVAVPNIISAHAVQETVIYFISNACLQALMQYDEGFAPLFYQRLLWLVGHQLQAVRARLISMQFDHEIMAISNLIGQNSTRLGLTSELHKVPHLLENKLTVSSAIRVLEALKSTGNSQEKNIAALSLDILQEITREQHFFDGLIRVYDTVVSAPAHLPPSEVRKQSAEVYADVFEKVPCVIRGWENLPEDSGHIFIYNHLRNHPINTLPNQFQLTLDSHFVSSLILHRKYGDPGIRIVRIGRGAEYGHQEYYQRLGHIDVYTAESEATDNEEQRRLQRELFFQQAGEHLLSGHNLIISPEGTSYPTEESPGPLKAGAFRLALAMKQEPLIVPVALANFDKRVRNNRFSCVIHQPFKVSDYLSNSRRIP